MAHLRAHGLAIDLPRGWHGAVVQRDASCGLSVLHAATVPLPAERGDAGGGVIERLGWGEVFVGVLEHESSSAGAGLFAADGLPLPLSPAWFVPGLLQGMRPRQSGAQRFFTLHGRAFGLVVVVGDHAGRAPVLRAVNRALATLRLEPRVGRR